MGGRAEKERDSLLLGGGGGRDGERVARRKKERKNETPFLFSLKSLLSSFFFEVFPHRHTSTLDKKGNGE